MYFPVSNLLSMYMYIMKINDILILIWTRNSIHHGKTIQITSNINSGGTTPRNSSHFSLLWRQNGRDGVSNHQPYDCLLSLAFMHRSQKPISASATGEYPAQMASNAENVSIWWRHNMLIKSIVRMDISNLFTELHAKMALFLYD